MVATRRSRATTRNAAVWATLLEAVATSSASSGPGPQATDDAGADVRVDTGALDTGALDTHAGGATAAGAARLDILDAGGGTGGFAVPLAELGHRVTVVDPSPDSLAALERRAAEADIRTIRGVQGDAAGLLDVAAPESYDVVLSHHVLEVVDDPTAAVAAMVRVLRPGGLLSVLVANRHGAVLSRAVAGRLDEAVEILGDTDGVAGPHDPLLRRFDRAGVLALLDKAGLEVVVLHGSRVFSDLLPGALLDADPAAAQALVRLEELALGSRELSDVAAALHVLARRPGHAGD